MHTNEGYLISFESVVEQMDSSVYYYHFIVPDHVVKPCIALGDKRWICRLNDAVEIHCALMPMGNGRYFITLNKEIRKKFGLMVGSTISASLRPDKSKYGMPMPEELSELLAIDDRGSKLFHALTPGKQRNLIYMVAKPKTVDTRVKNSIVIIDYLKAVDGRLDFRELNQAFKDYENI